MARQWIDFKSRGVHRTYIPVINLDVFQTIEVKVNKISEEL